MTRIFLLHATGTEDLLCASRIRQDLNLRGYAVHDEVQTLDVSMKLYQNSAQSALVGSAAVILLWSSDAARNVRLWNAVKFAQQLKRPVLAVTLDSTAFPEMLQGATPTLAVPPYDTVVASLVPSLPPAQSNAPLLDIYERAIDISPDRRKDAINDAAQLLKSGQDTQQRDILLALLECLAHYDPITSVQEHAQDVLSVQNTSPHPIVPPANPQLFDKGTFYEYVCSKGHVTPIDKNLLHQPNSQLVRRGVAVFTCKECKEQAKFKI